jgi:hypothetical protein
MSGTDPVTVMLGTFASFETEEGGFFPTLAQATLGAFKRIRGQQNGVPRQYWGSTPIEPVMQRTAPQHVNIVQGTCFI